MLPRCIRSGAQGLVGVQKHKPQTFRSAVTDGVDETSLPQPPSFYIRRNVAITIDRTKRAMEKISASTVPTQLSIALRIARASSKPPIENQVGRRMT